MDELITIIINLIVGLMGEKKPSQPKVPTRSAPMPQTTPLPNSRGLDSDSSPPLWRRPIDPRLAGRTQQMKQLAAARKPQRPAFRGVVRKSKQMSPPPLPRVVAKMVTAPVTKLAQKPAPPAKQPAPITGAKIKQLIQSQPVALRTIILLSEVIRPPLALRKSMREIL